MTEHQRPGLREKPLKAPLLSFSIEKEIEELQKEPAWKKGDRNAVTLQKDPNLRVVLISLHKGVTLHEHKVEGPITLFVLSGKINFIAGEDKVSAKSNGLIVLDKAIPHDVEALEDTAFILTIIQPK
ncbi:MAG TPA: hypothetical protein ENI61_06495 [Ignavibacteria bacterium]|nr:hypothetical protein [Ignavibacteria bacterium]